MREGRRGSDVEGKSGWRANEKRDVWSQLATLGPSVHSAQQAVLTYIGQRLKYRHLPTVSLKPYYFARGLRNTIMNHDLDLGR